MKRSIPILVAAMALAAIALADDVWKSKPYQQWDAKDVQKILNESPWVRVVHVAANWRKPGDNYIPVEPGGTSPGNYGAQTASAGGSGRDTSSVASSSSSSMPGGPTSANSGSLAQNQAIMNSGKTPEATFVVRWFSSLAVRQALARAQVLGGGMTAADADKALGDVPVEYAIVVAGQDMGPFLKLEEKDIAAKAFLQPKSGEKTAAAHVAIQRVPGGKLDDPRSIAAIVFYFAKKTAAGDPLLAPNTKSAEFLCESGKANIKASFDLSKMAIANAPDW